MSMARVMVVSCDCGWVDVEGPASCFCFLFPQAASLGDGFIKTIVTNIAI